MTTGTDIEEKELVSLNIKIATKDLVKRVDEKIVAVLPDIDLHSKISLRGKIIRLIAEESFSLISHERAEAVRGFVNWICNIAETQMAKPVLGVGQIKSASEEYLSKENK